MADASYWLAWDNYWLTFVGISAIMVITLLPFIMFTLYKYCVLKFQFQKVNSILPKFLVLNKASETVQLALANPMEYFSVTTFKMLDLKLIQIVLIIMSLIFTCYLLIKLILWTYDYLNTKYLNISSTRLTYLKTLIMDKTNVYLCLYDFATGDSVNLYMGTIF